MSFIFRQSVGSSFSERDIVAWHRVTSLSSRRFLGRLWAASLLYRASPIAFLAIFVLFLSIWILQEVFVAAQVPLRPLVGWLFTLRQDHAALKSINVDLDTISGQLNLEAGHFVDLLNLRVVSWISQDRVELILEAVKFFACLAQLLLVIEDYWDDFLMHSAVCMDCLFC